MYRLIELYQGKEPGAVLGGVPFLRQRKSYPLRCTRDRELLLCSNEYYRPAPVREGHCCLPRCIDGREYLSGAEHTRRIARRDSLASAR